MGAGGAEVCVCVCEGVCGAKMVVAWSRWRGRNGRAHRAHRSRDSRAQLGRDVSSSTQPAPNDHHSHPQTQSMWIRALLFIALVSVCFAAAKDYYKELGGTTQRRALALVPELTTERATEIDGSFCLSYSSRPSS